MPARPLADETLHLIDAVRAGQGLGRGKVSGHFGLWPLCSERKKLLKR